MLGAVEGDPEGGLLVVGEGEPVVGDLQAIPAASFGSWLSCNGKQPR